MKMPKEKYISVQAFANRYNLKTDTVKKNINRIAGIKLIDNEYLIPDSSRYPYNIGRNKLATRDEKCYVLLKATSQSRYVDETMLKMSTASFNTLITELVKKGLLQKNSSNNPHGANRYDTTLLADETLKNSKKKAMTEIANILAGAAAVYASLRERLQ